MAELTIKVAELIGNRATEMEQGDKIYSMIDTELKKGGKVIVDFNGLDTILSLFLNNAFGKLYKEYTSDFLNENLRIENISDDDLFIFKRVIKRAKEYYANDDKISSLLDEQLGENK